ncbi:hypothetical protein M885DRAFT_495864 [Pelagophyceae sp. CCMP2097]|nr:hypothetical protein M885DRAFT_495864 [Pelagophyceae sp. CCMP2097]
MQFNDAAVYAAAGPALCSVARAAAAAHEWHVALLAFESALKVLRKTHALAPPGELVDETDALILDVQESCVILTQHASVAHEWMWAANAVLAAGLSPEDRREDRKALARVPLRAYNLTISICAEAHQWRAALGILNEMAREGVLPTTETYIHVARAAFRGRAAEVTLGMLGALRHRAHRDSPDKFQVAAVDLKTMYSICLGACRDAARRATQQEDSAEEQAKATKFRGFSDDTPAYDVPQSVSSQSASSQRGFGPLRRAKDDDDDASPRLLEYHRARRKPARWANSTLTLLHMADADQINLGPSTRADAVIAVIVGGSPREACDIVSRSHPDVVKFIPQDIRKMLRQAALDIAGGDEDAPLVRLLGR